MKIAIISDTHLGYATHTEREEDAFIHFEEALDSAIEEKVDLILLGGDIFDSRVTSQDVLGRSMQLFLKPHTTEQRAVMLESATGKENITESAWKGTPVVAIHGTHERRGQGLTNPLHVLDKAGLVIHIHCATLVLNVAGERVAIHGMSGIPEKYAYQVLQEWNPKPVENAKNIFIMHQNLEEYIYSVDDIRTLKITDLPAGFDVLLNGHIHWPDRKKLDDKTHFAIIGSTIATQMRKAEANNPKGYLIYDGVDLKFKELKTPRKLYYLELEFNEADMQEVHTKIDEALKEIPEAERKPLVRLLLKGTLKKGIDVSDLNLSVLEKKNASKFIMHIGKDKLESTALLEKRQLIEQLRDQQLSVDELGHEILKKHLVELKYPDVSNIEELFSLLAAGDIESSLELLKA